MLLSLTESEKWLKDEIEQNKSLKVYRICLLCFNSSTWGFGSKRIYLQHNKQTYEKTKVHLYCLASPSIPRLRDCQHCQNSEELHMEPSNLILDKIDENPTYY